MKAKFANYITNDPIQKIYNSMDLLSYASYLSDELFIEAEYKDIIKDFIDCRNEFKNMVEAYLNGDKIDIDKFIEIGEQLKIIFYYEDPQEFVVIDKEHANEKIVIWILDYYKGYVDDIKNGDATPPRFTGEIGTVGYYGGYINDVNKLDDKLKDLYVNSLNELERKTLGF